MIYRIVLDGEDIMDPFNKKLFVLSPNLEMEINTAGSLSFMVGSDHAFYNQIHMLKSNIEVYEDDELIWFGRPVEQKFDFIKRKSIYCEGALAFFNDTVQRPIVYDQVSLHTFFKNVIAFHNSQVAEDRKFTVGSLTIADKPIYRKLGYENTFDVLKSKCLDAEGGYFFCRRENGINYIDWLKDIPNVSNQPIEFGLNLLDLNINFDGTSFATAVIPLGKKIDDNELTIASVNNGSIILESEAIDTYGRITTVVNFSDITDASKLKEEGRKYLENTQFNSLIIECTAAELHFQNENYNIFKIGQMVHCRSNPHVLDRDLPLSKISLRLDTAAKQITLGIIPKKTLTRFYKDNVDTIDSIATDFDGLTEYVGYDPVTTAYPDYIEDWDDWYEQRPDIPGIDDDTWDNWYSQHPENLDKTDWEEWWNNKPETIIDDLDDLTEYNDWINSHPSFPTVYGAPEYNIPSIDDNINDLFDYYNDLDQKYDDLADYLGYGDDATGNNILDNLSDRLERLEQNAPSSGNDEYYPKIWIGTEAQFYNDESQYIRSLDRAPVEGKQYYTFVSSIPGYQQFTGSTFSSNTVYYEKYSPKSDMVISFIVDEIPDAYKSKSMKVPSAWEVDGTPEEAIENDDNN